MSDLPEIFGRTDPSIELAIASLGVPANMLRTDRGQETTSSSYLVLGLSEARGYFVGRELVALDREFRRTTAMARLQALDLRRAVTTWARSGALDRGRPFESDTHWGQEAVAAEPGDSELTRKSKMGVYPDPPSSSGLRLVGAEPGSALLLLEPLGHLYNLLNADPVSVLLNAASLSGYVRTLSVYIRRQSDPLRGVTARQALTVLKEFQGDMSTAFGPPDATAGEVPLSITGPDGTVVKGERRIDYVRQDADGSITWITAQ